MRRVGGRAGGRGSGRNVPDITSVWQTVISYKDPHGRIWYGEQRPFVNAPINTIRPMTYVEHVIIGDAYTRLPNNCLVVGDDLQWPYLFNVRCENEIYCRWHGLKVPKARSANMLQSRYHDNDQTIHQLKREIRQMDKRLMRFHLIEHAKKWYDYYDDMVQDIEEDPNYASDYELSDYTDEDNDIDFQHYLPGSLMIDGKSVCCDEHGV